MRKTLTALIAAALIGCQEPEMKPEQGGTTPCVLLSQQSRQYENPPEFSNPTAEPYRILAKGQAMQMIESAVRDAQILRRMNRLEEQLYELESRLQEDSSEENVKKKEENEQEYLLNSGRICRLNRPLTPRELRILRKFEYDLQEISEWGESDVRENMLKEFSNTYLKFRSDIGLRL